MDFCVNWSFGELAQVLLLFVFVGLFLRAGKESKYDENTNSYNLWAGFSFFVLVFSFVIFALIRFTG